MSAFPTALATRARRAVRPTRRGGLFLGTGSALFIVGWAYDQRDLLFVAGVLVLVPLVALIYVLVHPVRVSVTRTFRPASVPAGLSATVTIVLRNLSSQPLAGLRWRDTAANGVTVPPAEPLRTLGPDRSGPATDSVVVSYPVRPPRRGSYPIGPLMLGRADPFGLAYSEWPVGEPHDLTVTPRVTPLPGNGVSITRGEGSRHERLRHLNNDSDELIAREYRPGDPMRRVNWPATARHGEIMVRQEEQRSHPEARVLLDTTRGRARPAGAQFERAVELVASIAVHLLDDGFRVDTIELGPAQLVPSPVAPRRSRPGEPVASADASQGGLRGDDPISFTGPEGSRALLDALAQVHQRARAADTGRGAAESAARPRAGTLGGRVPTFAVLVDTADGDTADLVALRPLCQPAVAFVFDTVSTASTERLGEAGWQVVPVTAATPADAAWHAAGQVLGGHRGSD